jgi:hypothetical protein
VLRTWIVLVLAAGVAVAAIVDGVRAGGSQTAAAKPAEQHRVRGDDQLVGPDIPPAGGLPGTLVLTSGQGCRVQTIVFAGPQASKPGVETSCGVWPSPSGGYAAVSTSRSPGGRQPAFALSLVRLSDPPSLVRQLGVAAAEPVWTPSGDEVAFCTPPGFTLVVNVAQETSHGVPGCHPRYTPDGRLLTVPAGPRSNALMRDGQVLLDAASLAHELPGADGTNVDVLDYDQRRDGVLAVTVTQDGRLRDVAALELWRDRQPLGSFLLSSGAGASGERVGQLVRFSPDGQELAIGPRTSRGGDPVTFFDLRLRKVSLEVDAQTGFAWSPDSAWLAVAQGDGVAFYSRTAGDAVYHLPVTAGGLGWVASPPGSG